MPCLRLVKRGRRGGSRARKNNMIQREFMKTHTPAMLLRHPTVTASRTQIGLRITPTSTVPATDADSGRVNHLGSLQHSPAAATAWWRTGSAATHTPGTPA
eukprot:1322086-Pyramimonas_sp.AAC.1